MAMQTTAVSSGASSAVISTAAARAAGLAADVDQIGQQNDAQSGASSDGVALAGSAPQSFAQQLTGKFFTCDEAEKSMANADESSTVRSVAERAAAAAMLVRLNALLAASTAKSSGAGTGDVSAASKGKSSSAGGGSEKHSIYIGSVSSGSVADSILSALMGNGTPQAAAAQTVATAAAVTTVKTPADNVRGVAGGLAKSAVGKLWSGLNAASGAAQGEMAAAVDADKKMDVVADTTVSSGEAALAEAKLPGESAAAAVGDAAGVSSAIADAAKSGGRAKSPAVAAVGKESKSAGNDLKHSLGNAGSDSSKTAADAAAVNLATAASDGAAGGGLVGAGHNAAGHAGGGASGNAVAVGAASGGASFGSHVVNAANSSDKSGSGEAFTRLDAAASTGAPAHTVMSASSQQVEVGVQDAAHGWVSVRAEMSAGAVQATLVPASSAAEHSLRAGLPGMSAYLEQQRVSVSGLSVSTSSETTMNFGRQNSSDHNSGGQDGNAGAMHSGSMNSGAMNSGSGGGNAPQDSGGRVLGMSSSAAAVRATNAAVNASAYGNAYGVGGQINVIA